METIEIKKSTLIDVGNFYISIGIYDTTEIAIVSKSTGKICMFYYIKRGGKLAKVKRKFKQWLNSNEYFTFSGMSETTTLELIAFLKKETEYKYKEPYHYWNSHNY